MSKILVIAPYEGLKNLVIEVNEELKKNIDVYAGNLYEGLAIAKSLEYRQYDAIISRGATAKLLEKHFSIPVMEIQLTGYDILRTFTLLNGHSGKIGIMSYLNVIQGADIVGKLLDMNVTLYPLNEEKEIEEKVELASQEGVQVIIGDVISTTVASRFGMQTILIASGKEAIVDTLLQTERLVYHINNQKEQLNNIQSIFNHLDEGVLVFDDNHVCTFVNEQAKSLFYYIDKKESFHLNRLIEIFPKLGELFAGHERDLDREISMKIKEVNYKWRIIQLTAEINSGFAVTIKRQVDKQQSPAEARQAYFHFNSLVAKSESMTNLIKMAKRVSLSKLPVIIYGEPGVGKESLAQAIHNNSERQNGPYVFVNCEAYSEAQLERELFGSDSVPLKQGVLERADGGTLFIDGIGMMPLGLQAKLLHVVTSGYMSRLNGSEKFSVDIRFITAYRDVLDACVHRGDFREDLYYALNGFNFKIPPLRERKEDIDDLSRLFIASVNMLTGKQISGLREDVMKELRELPWQGNIQQLKYVVEQMCLMCEGPFIEKREVQEVLDGIRKEELKKQAEESNLLQIMGKTLVEIEQDVIRTVLEQETYNQSQAAKRLGIDRSTLWRKMKSLNI